MSEKNCTKCAHYFKAKCGTCEEKSNWQPKQEEEKTCQTCNYWSASASCGRYCKNMAGWQAKIQGKEVDEVIVDDMQVKAALTLAQAFAALKEGKRVQHNGAEAVLNASFQMVWTGGASSVAVCTITQEGWAIIPPQPPELDAETYEAVIKAVGECMRRDGKCAACPFGGLFENSMCVINTARICGTKGLADKKVAAIIAEREPLLAAVKKLQADDMRTAGTIAIPVREIRGEEAAKPVLSDKLSEDLEYIAAKCRGGEFKGYCENHECPIRTIGNSGGCCRRHGGGTVSERTKLYIEHADAYHAYANALREAAERKQPKYVDYSTRKCDGCLVYGDGASIHKAQSHPNFEGYVYDNGECVAVPRQYRGADGRLKFVKLEGDETLTPIAVRFKA